MKWKDKLVEWKSGNIPDYPNRIKKSFFWETTPVTKSLNTKYKEKYIQSKMLDDMGDDYSSFKSHITKSKNKNVLTFYNLSKTALLVVPKPRKGKEYTTLKQFMDNASTTQQKAFWKKVASSVKKMLKKHDKVWVSTHGTGVPYLHVRIDTDPKYYRTDAFR